MMNPATKFILDNPRCAVFLRTGYGKTRITLDALEHDMVFGKTEKILVIAPKLVALDTWPKECEGYSFDPTVITGTREERLARLREDNNFFVIGVDNVAWLVETGEFDFDCVVIDESSKFKDPDSVRFHMLSQVTPYCRRVILLSGTPISNGIQNIWAQIFLLDGGARLGKEYVQFRDYYFYHEGSFRWVPYDNSESLILEHIKDICYNEESEEVEKIPMRNHIIRVKLDEDSRGIYNQMRLHFIYEWSKELSLTAPNVGVAMNKLLQICSGSAYVQTKPDPEKNETVRKVTPDPYKQDGRIA